MCCSSSREGLGKNARSGPGILSCSEYYMKEDESGLLFQPSTVKDDLLLHENILYYPEDYM